MKLQTIQNAILRLTKADIAFYILPPIMLILTAGTIAQREMGLYAAQKKFFGSFVLWTGPLPLPGFYTFVTVLGISLLLKFLLQSDWAVRKAGIHLTHLGVIILLFGGLLTGLTAREGYMLIGEGDTNPYAYDYQKRELFVFEDNRLLHTIPFEKLKPGSIHTLPFELAVRESCVNCNIRDRESETKEKMRGMAQFMALEHKEPENEPEQNLSGITFDLSGLGKQDGTYIAFEAMPKPIEVRARARNYKIIFGRQQRLLPFSVRLDDFIKEDYPGTDKARNFISNVTIIDGGAEWPARIEMNEPLRYKGYTLYQSSFEQTETGEMTLLSVVENKGRLFPYIGTLLMTLGLLLHVFLMNRGKKT